MSLLVAQAMPLWERLDHPPAQESSAAPDPALADAVIERWCKSAGTGDWDAFKRRLEWDGWNIEQVRAALAGPPALPATPPPWAEVVEQLMLAAQAMAERPEDSAFNSPGLDPGHPIIYEDVLMPALAVARERLRTCLGADPATFPLLAPEA